MQFRGYECEPELCRADTLDWDCWDGKVVIVIRTVWRQTKLELPGLIWLWAEIHC